MSFADPQSVTVSGTTTPLPRVSTGNGASTYQSADGLITLSASSAYGKRTRRVIRLDHSKITSDPFIPTQNTKVSMSNYIVFDVPPAGYSLTEAQAIWTGLNTAVAAGSGLLITKLLGGES